MRALFECACRFTAGTSFAWEKHLALRNTPYSSVKHSRGIRAGGNASAVSNSFTRAQDAARSLSRAESTGSAEPGSPQSLDSMKLLPASSSSSTPRVPDDDIYLRPSLDHQKSISCI